MTPLVDPAVATSIAGAWAGIIVPVVIKGSLLLGLFGVFNLVLRHASASTRHLLWTLSLVAILFLPIFITGLPAWRVLDLGWFAPAEKAAQEIVASAAPVLPALGATHITNSTPPATASPGPAGDVSSQPASSSSPGLLSSLMSLPVTTWIFFIWQAGVLMLLGTILCAAIRLWSLERSARSLSENGWGELLDSLCGKLQIAKPPRLLRSDRELTPMTWGVRRAKVLLPANCDNWTNDQRRQVLLHELAHVKRRDCLTHIAAQLSCLLYWFNPLVWIAARRMRVERERACDDQVLVTGVKASSYASNLLDIACSFGPDKRTLAVSLGMARRSQISGRLLAVLDPKRRRLAPGRHLTMAVAVFTLAIALPLAAMGPAADAREDGDRTVTITSGGDDLTVKHHGEIELTRDGRDIEWMSVGAFFSVKQKIGGTWHELTIKPDEDGKPQHDYTVGDRYHDFDPEAADWLAEVLEDAAPDSELHGAGSLTLPPLPSLPSLPEIPSLPELPSLSMAGSMNIRSSDSHTEIKWKRDDGVELELEMKRRIKFNDDATAIEWMDDDAYFKLKEKKGRRKTTIEAEPDEDGRPVYTYKIGRKAQPFDDEAAKWLAGALQTVVIELGIDADTRVQDTYEKKGSAGVFALIGQVDSSHSKSIYYREYFALDGLSDGEIVDGLEKMADDIESDYEMVALLTPNVDALLVSDDRRKAFLKCMSSVESDYETARVLKAALLHRDDMTYDEMAVVLEAASTIESDYELARVLTAIDPDLLANETLRRAYFEAFEDIGSDYEKARVLLSLSRPARQNEELRKACINAAQSIESDYEYGKVVRALR